MTDKQITLKQALELVEFEFLPDEGWRVRNVQGSVHGYVQGSVFGCVQGTIRGNVYGTIYGDVYNVMGSIRLDVKGTIYGDVNGDVGGTVYGDVYGDVRHNVYGNVGGSVKRDVKGDVEGNVIGFIDNRRWEFTESPKDKLKRLIEDTGDKKLIKAFIQFVASDD